MTKTSDNNLDNLANYSPLSTKDIIKIHMLVDEVSRDETKLKNIKAGKILPDDELKRKNRKIPEGWHSHVVDSDNHYYPSEADVLTQIKNAKQGEIWNRVEVRYGVGPLCWALCIFCL